MSRVDVRSFPAFRVAYVRHVGPYGPEIVKAWEKLMPWVMQKGLMTAETLSLAAYWDDPKKTPPQACRADVCVTVPEGMEPDPAQGIEIQTLPAGKYAMILDYIDDCDWASFPQLWERAFKAYDAAGLGGCCCSCQASEPRPCYEMYYNCGMSNPLKKWVLDICIPVA